MNLCSHRRRILQVTVLMLVTGSTFAALPHLLVTNSGKNIVSKAEQAPKAQVAVTLGALVQNDGKPSWMFADRLKQAITLYKLGHVRKILVSGDHGQTEYDEVNPAKQMLLQAGVKPQDIFLDHAGFDTYDSMVRAKQIFGVQTAIIISQHFHLPRALYIAKSVGIHASGLSADLRPYGNKIFYELREEGAKIKAFVDVERKAKPKFGGPPIPIEGDGRKSWD